jgi:glycopeptide antibiotics resistance protein
MLRWLGDAVPEVGIALVPAAVVLLVLVMLRAREGGLPVALRVTLPDAAIAITVVPLLVLTLRPVALFGEDATRINLIPLREEIVDALGPPGLGFAVIELLGNILAFAAVGAALAWRFRRLSMRVAGIGVGILSLGIETAQAFIDAGRTADITDLATNLAGGLLGFVVVRKEQRRAEET